MEETNQQPKNNGIAKMLGQLNMPTLIVILLSGGGNWFATKQTSDESRHETDRAITEIHELHKALIDFENRQKDTLSRTGEALTNQEQMLRNQTRMLDNQMSVLQQIKKVP